MRAGVGIRTRIIGVSVVIVTLVVAVLGLIIWRAMTAALTATAHESLRGTVALIGNDLGTMSPTEAVPQGIRPDGNRIQQVLDASGDVLAASSAAAGSVPIITPSQLPVVGQVSTFTEDSLPALDGAPAVLAVTRVVDGEGQTVTVLAAERVAVQPEIGLRLGLILTLVLGVAILALALILRYAVGSALDPVDRMRRDLERITSSRQARPVDTPEVEDEIGQLGRAINALLARLHRSDEVRTAFVSDAGHELRSPLTTLGISLDQLAEDLSPDRRTEVAGRARGELERLHRLTEDLLALAKSDEGGVQGASTEIDLDDLILSEADHARDQGVSVDLSLEPVRIMGVPDQMRRVLRNLMDNAVRHARTEVRVRVRAFEGRAEVAIDNDGAPIPEADRVRVFDRFVRLDEARARDQGGSGLGLAIVSELVHGHGGHVEASESADGWCRFQVTLPLPDPDDEVEPTGQTGQAEQTELSGLNRASELSDEVLGR